jgi:hypothetical protein
MGCIVGSAACALKSDATKAQESGAKGIGARRNGQAQRELEDWPGPAAGETGRPDPESLQAGGRTRWSMAPNTDDPSPSCISIRIRSPKRMKGVVALPVTNVSTVRCSAMHE